jgi:hypothetical protein
MDILIYGLRFHELYGNGCLLFKKYRGFSFLWFECTFSIFIFEYGTFYSCLGVLSFYLSFLDK